MALWLMINAASGSTSSASIGATYSVVIDRHISDIMSVWNSDELTYEWTPTLQSISQVKTRDMGELSHQQYKLPWPLLPRDMLLQCDRKIMAKTAKVTSECKSVVSSEVPERSGVVRMTLERTSWELEALNGDRTRITLTLVVPASMAVGVPNFVVKYCQKSSLKDSISQLLAAVQRLKLPPHRTFVGWRRSRAEMLAAGAAGSDSAGAGLLSWVGAGTLPLLAIALAHVIAFACAANRWRASRSRRGPACGDEVPVSDCAEVKPPRVKTLRQGLTLRLHGGLIMLLR